MSFWQWSKTPTLNGTADPTINWAEGMPPSVVNDSARAMMAALAQQQADISGSLVTAGGPTAYTVTSNQGYPDPPQDKQLIAVTLNATNGSAPTLSVDGGIAAPIYSSPTSPVVAGAMLVGMPFMMVYNATDSRWMLVNSIAATSATVLRGYIDGLTMSAPGASPSFAINPGSAVDSNNTTMMTLGSAYTKTSGAWAVGSANGSLDTGTILASALYYVYLIQRPDTGVTDILISRSLTAPTMPASYTLKRRIGSLFTDSSAQWRKFVQVGDEFLWDTPALDWGPTFVTAGGATVTLAAPGGFSTQIWFAAQIVNSSPNNGAITFWSPLTNSPGAGSVQALYTQSSTQGNAAAGHFRIMSGLLSNISARSGAQSVELRVYTLGWIDNRGKDS